MSINYQICLIWNAKCSVENEDFVFVCGGWIMLIANVMNYICVILRTDFTHPLKITKTPADLKTLYKNDEEIVC